MPAGTQAQFFFEEPYPRKPLLHGSIGVRLVALVVRDPASVVASDVPVGQYSERIFAGKQQASCYLVIFLGAKVSLVPMVSQPVDVLCTGSADVTMDSRADGAETTVLFPHFKTLFSLVAFFPDDLRSTQQNRCVRPTHVLDSDVHSHL